MHHCLPSVEAMYLRAHVTWV